MNTLQIKPIRLKYHRNGVSGIGFYALSFDWRDPSSKEHGHEFIATFEVDDNDQTLKIESCRVIKPNDILNCWRGDNFAWAIQRKFTELGQKYCKPMVYDLIEVINIKENGKNV